MTSDRINAEIESIREMGRNMADRPMQDLQAMTRTVAGISLSAGSYGAFGLLGSSLEDSFEEVKQAAMQYLAIKRRQASDIHVKAYDTANGYLDGDANAAGLAAKMPQK